MAKRGGTKRRQLASVAAAAAGVAAVPCAASVAREVGFTGFTATSYASHAGHVASQRVTPSRVFPETPPSSTPDTRNQKVGAGVGSAAILAGVATAVGHGAKKRCGKGSVGSTTCLSTSTVLEKAATNAVEPAKLFEQYVKDRGGERVLRKLLIANNGMAATKAILSLRQWSYLELGSDNVFEFVVMATPEDLEANAEFIRLANSYVEVPGGKNVNNYANVDLIVDVAKSQGAKLGNRVWAAWVAWPSQSRQEVLFG